MINAEYVPNPKIVDRAVELWVQMLEKPKFDNGDRSMPGIVARGLAAQIPANNTREVLARFGAELRKILLAPLEWGSEGFGKNPPTRHTTLFRDLHVDYHPDIPLREAARRAGLEMEFPWKTSMWLYENHLSLRCGYGAEVENHWPLRDGRWLVLRLDGSDVTKIIPLVEADVIDLNLVAITKP